MGYDLDKVPAWIAESFKPDVWEDEMFSSATKKEVLMSGLFGHLYTADIHISSRVDPNTWDMT